MKRVLAFDFGASSGRAIIASYDGDKITLEEVHRFSNDPVMLNGTLYWDALRLFFEIKQGIIKAKLAGGFDSIGVDTWGVDFGLIDEKGCLVENPVHYRDARTKGIIEEAEKLISKKEMYDITGIQFMEFNTAFQLLSIKRSRPELFDRAAKLLFMPDLFSYFLTGKTVAEYSIATTSQLVEASTGKWSQRMCEALGVPARLLPEIVMPGATVGMLSDAICEELGVPAVPVIAVCGHDTQSAVSAVPAAEKDFVFISSGTWSLFGTEVDAPIINDETRAFNVTNEGGFDGAIAFLKNICGLWLIQESRRQWRREGKEYSFAELETLAKQAEPFRCFIDPDATDFVQPGDMPGRVREFCRRTGQYVPETVGGVIRCIYESLAMKYRHTFAGIQNCTGKKYERIYVVGGGTKDKFLLGMTADACGVTVSAGPVEATVMGNVAAQFIAAGVLKDIPDARAAVSRSCAPELFAPGDAAAWDEAYPRFTEIL
ncbi:MAG: rhamnulokinase [Clostridia bacterium]|nr:rhamnulokinase [Clostridia bacterium]